MFFFHTNCCVTFTLRIFMHAFKANLYSFLIFLCCQLYAFSLIQLFSKCWVWAKRITENVWASFVCMFVWVCALANILLQKCVLYNRIILQFKWKHSIWSGTLQKRHFVRVHAMLHKYWLLQKISVRAIVYI